MKKNDFIQEKEPLIKSTLFELERVSEREPFQYGWCHLPLLRMCQFSYKLFVKCERQLNEIIIPRNGYIIYLRQKLKMKVDFITKGNCIRSICKSDKK